MRLTEKENLTTIAQDIDDLSIRSRDNWMPGLYRRLLDLFELSEPPKEDELQPALYVMF